MSDRNFEIANGATEAMTESYYDSMEEPGKPEVAYINPNQFEDGEYEAIIASHPHFEDETEYADVVEMAKTLSNVIKAAVKIQVWDGPKYDYGTTQLDDETYFPNRMEKPHAQDLCN